MKEKEPVIHRLRFGIDIDGTITQAPSHFKRLIDALIEDDHYVYVITARDEGRRRETEQLLESFCIKHHRLVMKPVDWQGSITDWKVHVVKETKVQLMFDDEEENCWAIQQQTPCLTAHALPIPEVRREFEALARDRERRKAKARDEVTKGDR